MKLNFCKISKNTCAGFMLEEVMIAMVITSLVIMPILSFVGNYMMLSTRYKDKSARLIVMKNFMLQQTYFAKEDKSKKKSVNEKIKEPVVLDLKYERVQMGKAQPFDKLQESQLQCLLKQQVEGTFGKNKERIVCFLYKP